MESVDRTLDAGGLKRPLPLLRTPKQLGQVASGEVLAITGRWKTRFFDGLCVSRGSDAIFNDDESFPGPVRDLGAFCAGSGHQLLSCHEIAGGFAFRIRKN